MTTEAKIEELLARIDSMEDGVPVERVRLTDKRDGLVYRHDERTRTALKVALITGRPLLLVGPPGCGKSSLAPYVARNLGFSFFTYTVTETAEVSDLHWRVDYLRRFNDAQLGRDASNIEDYIDRGVLWRAFEPPESGSEVSGTVVLIDEIDKADAGFSNSLLVSIGSQQFDVPPLENRTISASADTIVLVIMTSNQERALPPALLRRCVVLSVEYPSAEHLIEVARRMWPGWMADPSLEASVSKLAHTLVPDEITPDALLVSTAEFVDLVQVLKQTGIEPSAPLWKEIESLVLLQSNDPVV